MSTNTSAADEAERRAEDGDNVGSPALPTPTNRGGGSCSSLLFLIVMLFMLVNNGTDDMIVRNQYIDSLKSLRFQQSNFSEWLESGGRTNASNFSMVCHYGFSRVMFP